MKYTKLFQFNFRDVFHFSTRKTRHYFRSSLNVCEATRKARGLQAASAYRRQEFWRETHTTLWLLIGRTIFLTLEKALFAIVIGLFFFFTCEKHRSLLWLVRTHLRMKICHIFSVSMYLSMYTLYRGDLTLYNKKKIDVEFRSIITLPHYFLHHSKKTGLDIWKRAIWKLQNKYQLRVCVINATINTLTEWLHRHKKILMLSSSVVCLLFTI